MKGSLRNSNPDDSLDKELISSPYTAENSVFPSLLTAFDARNVFVYSRIDPIFLRPFFPFSTARKH